MDKKILITGATGFVGRQLCAKLAYEGVSIRGTLLPNEDSARLCTGVEAVTVAPLSSTTSWAEALQGISTIFHLAARVHIMRETSANPLNDFRIANTDGTRTLARQAVAAGVRRLVFMSTIGVNGNQTPGTRAFTAMDDPHPFNPYSTSKYEAEQILWEISKETGLEVVIVRAPLVYGPGNPGNFLKLLRIVDKRIPLPFASVANKRSLVYVGNLVDALITCGRHLEAVGKLFLVSDSEVVSTPELITLISRALDRPVRMFPVHPAVICASAALFSKRASVSSLIGSLVVDSSRIRQILDWKPPYTMDQGLSETAIWYNETYKSAKRR